jgi:hypothetical protein
LFSFTILEQTRNKEKTKEREREKKRIEFRTMNVSLLKLIIKCLFKAFLIQFINANEFKLSNSHEFLTSGMSSSKCEPLDTDLMPLCKDIAYNETRFPNFMKQKSQQEAAAETAIYLPLIRINCSPVLKLFLCSLYAPPCVKNYSSTLKPCREMCEKARMGCEDIMKRYTFEWPDYLECSRFPSFNGPEACVTDENYALQPSSYSSIYPSNKVENNLLANLSPKQLQAILNSLSISSSAFDQNPFYPIMRVKFVCPATLQLLTDTKNTYYLVVNDESINNCAMPCDKNLFTQDEIAFSRSWLFIWSLICFISTLFTMLTFLIETSRFRYPERPIIFLSGCYMIISLAYLIGSTQSNNSLICKSYKSAKMQNVDYLVQGVEHVPCTLLFMMIYYFGMASSVWWVVLTLTWFLAAGLKWGHEAIENVSSYFHLAAWAIPGVKLIAVLWMQKIDADILSGTCYTGIRNTNLMRGFVLAPLFLYLILGTCFLLAGFVSLVRIRNVMKHEGNKTDKLEKFMVRIGVFSILYMVPAIIVICCYFYEQSSYNKWIDYWLFNNRLEFNLAPDYVANLYDSDRSSLVFSFFMVKYAMLLVVGITSGFWIWSNKTIISWQKFFDKIFVCFQGLKPKYKNEAAV